MYVCGRGTDGLGTVLPAVYQSVKEGLDIEEIVFADEGFDLLADFSEFVVDHLALFLNQHCKCSLKNP